MQMSKTTKLQQIVKAKILTAFELTPYHGDDTLLVDHNNYDPESEQILNDFKGKNWKDISVEVVRRHKEALSRFTPASFRYYLPSYMIACVDSYYDVDVALDSVLFNLTPPQPRTGWEWNFFWDRAKQFNEQEREAIRSFLELIDHYERADWASEGMEQPVDRVKPALDFWRGLTRRV
jgi:hypothetical protein